MSKFCGNCGAQMEDQAKVCGMCGTPFTETKQPVYQSHNTNRITTQMNVLPSSISKSDGTLTVMYLGETLLLVLLGILSMVKMFKAEILGMSTTFTLKQLFDGLEAVPVIMSILIFVAAILSVIPVFTTPKKRRFIFQIVISVLAFVLLVFTYIIEANSDEAALYDFTLTFSGWLYLFICLANILLSVLISKKSKQ